MQMNTTGIAVLLILQRGGDRLLKTRRFPYAAADANTRTYTVEKKGALATN